MCLLSHYRNDYACTFGPSGLFSLLDSPTTYNNDSELILQRFTDGGRLFLLIYENMFISIYTCIIHIDFFVPRHFEEKPRDIVFGFLSFRPSFRPTVRPSFRPPIGVCTLCAQLLLQFYSDSFETLQMSSSCFEDVHVVWI